jgi:hypothetical protein
MLRTLLVASALGLVLGVVLTDRPDDHRAKPVGPSVHLDSQGRVDFIWTRDAQGRLQGPQIECNDRGEVIGVADYQDDQLHGLTRWWKPDGSLAYAFVYHRDRNLGPADPKQVGDRPEGLCRLPSI